MAEAKVDTGLDRNGLMKREERNTWSRMYFMYACVQIYIHMCTNAFIYK